MGVNATAMTRLLLRLLLPKRRKKKLTRSVCPHSNPNFKISSRFHFYFFPKTTTTIARGGGRPRQTNEGVVRSHSEEVAFRKCC